MKTPKGIIFSCLTYELLDEEISFFCKTNPLGFVLFKRNYRDKDQLNKLIIQLKKISLNKNALIFVDQEGGKVQRFDGEGFTKFPSQSFFGDLYKTDKQKAISLAYKSSFLMGFELKQINVDVNFSPVCDIFFSEGDDVIGTRSFSEDPSAVFNLSKAFCDGLCDSKIYPVLKHFPGHGRSMHDTHIKKSIVSASFKDLEKVDFVPFKLLENQRMVMLAHIIYKNIDNEVATFSKVINQSILRDKFLFKGLILSDDLSMKALSGSIINKVKKTYDAGCDVILYCKAKLDEMRMIYPNTLTINKSRYEYFISKFSHKKKTNDILSIKKDLISAGVII